MFSQCFTKSFISTSRNIPQVSRRFATGSVSKKPSISVPQKRATWKEWASHNQQSLINIFALALFLQYAIQNYELKSKWDEHENELIFLDSELKRIKNIVNDDQWLDETTKKMRGFGAKSSVLKDALNAKFKPPKEESASEKVKKQQIAIDEALKDMKKDTPSTPSSGNTAIY